MSQPVSVALFDAVGTVIAPNPSVTDVYTELGHRFGSELSRSQIKTRIAQARQKYFHVGSSAAGREDLEPLISSEAIERELWKRLVLDVFHELESADALFEELWRHFADPKQWVVYDDVVECWSKLNEYGFKIGLASNFDARLIDICQAKKPLSRIEFIYCSSEVGFRKPCPNFYRNIESDLESRLGTSKLQIAMVGDDRENDCVAPNLAGWKSVWLNRSPSNQPAVDAGSCKIDQVNSVAQFAELAIRQFSSSF